MVRIKQLEALVEEMAIVFKVSICVDITCDDRLILVTVIYSIAERILVSPSARERQTTRFQDHPQRISGRRERLNSCVLHLQYWVKVRMYCFRICGTVFDVLAKFEPHRANKAAKAFKGLLE